MDRRELIRHERCSGPIPSVAEVAGHEGPGSYELVPCLVLWSVVLVRMSKQSYRSCFVGATNGPPVDGPVEVTGGSMSRCRLTAGGSMSTR